MDITFSKILKERQFFIKAKASYFKGAITRT